MGEEYNYLGTNISRQKISKSIFNKVKEDRIRINEQLNIPKIILENPDLAYFLPKMYVQIKRLVKDYLLN